MDRSIASPDQLFDSSTLNGLVRRLELHSTLLRRLEEEAIVALVPLQVEWIKNQIEQLLAGSTTEAFLAQRRWTESDLRLHVCRPEALRLFAEQHFGPGLEEQFLSSRGAHDQIIYSLLRVHDPSLIRELWIRIEESETTFAEAAQIYGEGPEAARKGLIGPMSIGQLAPPQLADLLRSLQPGCVSAPRQLGEWHVLLRLEQLNPARFDANMKATMLQNCLNSYLDDRVNQLLSKQPVEPFTYHPEP